MRNSFNLFESELISLKEFINYQLSTSKLLNDLKKSNVLGDEYFEFNIAKKKIYNYNSYIITLYGFLERFIENLLSGFGPLWLAHWPCLYRLALVVSRSRSNWLAIDPARRVDCPNRAAVSGHF